MNLSPSIKLHKVIAATLAVGALLFTGFIIILSIGIGGMSMAAVDGAPDPNWKIPIYGWGAIFLLPYLILLFRLFNCKTGAKAEIAAVRNIKAAVLLFGGVVALVLALSLFSRGGIVSWGHGVYLFILLPLTQFVIALRGSA